MMSLNPYVPLMNKQLFFLSLLVSKSSNSHNIIASKLKVIISRTKYYVAPGNNGHVNHINPYPPNFNKTPANITDPATGASTCTCGNHI